MTPKLWIAAGLAFASGVSGAAAATDDYARGIEVSAPPGHPLVQISLPDAVYQGIARADLADLRVFNAEGRPVPHALCAAPQSAPPTVSEVPLGVFELRESGAASRQTNVAVQTAAGTRVQVQEGRSEAQALEAGRTHIIDARPAEGAIKAIAFDWRSPDGASEARVRIESSSDLDEWNVVVPQTTLLRVRRDGQELRRERIDLPQREYAYLRVARTDQGPPLVIEAARGERVSAPTRVEPFWFDANVLTSSDPDTLDFDARRLAPIMYARLRLPEDNSAVRISIQSRADEESSWRTHWSGEAYRYVSGSNVRESAPVQFASTAHRYWRVQTVDGTPIPPGAKLALGYHPAKLRFLSQGAQPFVVAFGSVRADPVRPIACEDLLRDVSAEEREALIGDGELGSLGELAGEEAFRPLPRKTPVRLIVLWSVLIAGVVVVVGMALTLLKRLRAQRPS